MGDSTGAGAGERELIIGEFVITIQRGATLLPHWPHVRLSDRVRYAQ